MEDKQLSKYNAVKHGALTRILLDSEVEEAERLYEEFVNDYSPETQTEFILIQDMAAACIRKSRAINAEKEFFLQVLNPLFIVTMTGQTLERNYPLDIRLRSQMKILKKLIRLL